MYCPTEFHIVLMNRYDWIFGMVASGGPCIACIISHLLKINLEAM
jgi:hypothetical protein